jgi:hypothetical protein
MSFFPSGVPGPLRLPRRRWFDGKRPSAAMERASPTARDVQV